MRRRAATDPTMGCFARSARAKTITAKIRKIMATAPEYGTWPTILRACSGMNDLSYASVQLASLGGRKFRRGVIGRERARAATTQLMQIRPPGPYCWAEVWMILSRSGAGVVPLERATKKL